MSKDHSKLSAIERLLALFSRPAHDYRPTTEIFLDLNVSRIADTLRLAKRGRERGAKNRPPSDACKGESDRKQQHGPHASVHENIKGTKVY
jgi:hypothetical protein